MKEPSWAKVVIAAFVFVVYLWGHYIAWRTSTGLEIMIGADSNMCAAVVFYWFGSSAGSDKKTDLLSKEAPKP